MKEHFILSNYLKASKTFAIYRDVFKSMSVGDIYSPIEIRTFNPSQLSVDELSKLGEFIKMFKRNPKAISIVVSNPFKQCISEYCDEMDDVGKQMNTVNLIQKKSGKLVGMNIDGEAFFLGQREAINYDFRNQTVLFLGCGGVSTAVAFKLAGVDTKAVYLFDIHAKKAKVLGKKLRQNFPNLTVRELSGIDNRILSQINVIYNGTGIGKKSDNPQSVDESPLINSLLFPAGVLAIDANYTPWKTKFLDQCGEKGCRTLNGFSHMIAFTSLHLSRVLDTQIEVGTVMEIGRKYVRS